MSFRQWPIILGVVLVLSGLEFESQWIGIIPGYSALREAYPYYVGNSYRSLIEVILVFAVALALLRGAGRGAMDMLGIGGAPWHGLMAAALMVLPLYLVFAFAFTIVEIVPMEVLYLSAISPFAEELAYRGLAFGLLRKVAGWGFWPAALLPAAFFAYGHLGQASDLTEIIMTLALTGVGALVFAWLFEKWGSLWVPIGLHIAMNFAWNLFAVGDGAYAGLLPTIMQVTTIVLAITLTIYRDKIRFLRRT